MKVFCSCVSFNKKAKFSSFENLFLNLYFKVINVNVLKFDVILYECDIKIRAINSSFQMISQLKSENLSCVSVCVCVFNT